MFDDTLYEMRLVVTVNCAVVWPEDIITTTGTLVSAESVEMFTAIPPAGAGFINVTVPVVVLPPTIVVGRSVKVLMVYGETIVSLGRQCYRGGTLSYCVERT